VALYQCHVPARSLDADTRNALAEAITNVHAAVINVPTIFVNVVFTEYDPTAFYTGGRPNSVSVINGTLRAGHDSTLRGELLTKLSASWCSVTGHQPHQILLCLNEVDATDSMEAGMMLPGFGEEAVWTRQHTREIGDMHSRG
jgi:phenylpyruvate tautomerase PptA (4-oxalocrotonate tautomerase family)